MCWTSLAILYRSFIGEPLQEKCADIVIDAQFLSHMPSHFYMSDLGPNVTFNFRHRESE